MSCSLRVGITMLIYGFMISFFLFYMRLGVVMLLGFVMVFGAALPLFQDYRENYKRDYDDYQYHYAKEEQIGRECG